MRARDLAMWDPSERIAIFKEHRSQAKEIADSLERPMKAGRRWRFRGSVAEAAAASATTMRLARATSDATSITGTATEEAPTTARPVRVTIEFDIVLNRSVFVAVPFRQLGLTC